MSHLVHLHIEQDVTCFVRLKWPDELTEELLSRNYKKVALQVKYSKGSLLMLILCSVR